VTKDLEPIRRRLGPNPTPSAILAVKVCDSAMGSGALLVEAMRQLAKLLVEAWNRHGIPPRIPADETPIQFTSRLSVQRCLYGVDKNRMAVDLAKLSLWLATLARGTEIRRRLFADQLAFPAHARDLLFPRVIGGPRIRTCECPRQAYRRGREACLSGFRELHHRRVPAQPRGWNSAQ